MPVFRMDNTEGYAQAELDAMNRAFKYLVAACPCSADSKSWRDRLAERVQLLFDQGWRGGELIKRADRLEG
ncbi:MAG: hypothetical protein KGL39_40810 [Patescibacteria group bacterium]|nr:hypothetical protein [Patescibacteria group bacterium]